MCRNIYMSLLRDLKLIRQEQENNLKATKRLEARLKNLANPEPRQWMICGLKITRKQKEEHLTNDSFSSLNDHIYHETPANLNYYEGTHL